VEVASKAVLARLDLSSDGGPGGKAGSRGSRGSAGSEQWCRYTKSTSRGKDGREGREGRAGKPGPEGEVDARVVPAAKLELIQRFLKANPTMSLDDDGLDGAPEKPRRKRR
jgi:hypothetical protein